MIGVDQGNGAARARFYPNGSRYTVVVVEAGRHYFYDCETAAEAEALVRLVGG